MNLLVPGKAVPRLLLSKLLLIMRLTAVLLLAAALQVSAKTFSQKVSISGKNLSLGQVFQQIKKQTGYNFIYQDNLIQKTDAVSLDVKSASLTDVLKACLQGKGLTYQIKNDIIVITKAENKPANAPPALDEMQAAAPLILDITGRVTNEDGDPLPGAYIRIKGLLKGTTANSKGEFALKDVAVDAVLLVSYVGYELQPVLVNNKKTLSIVLKLNAKLEEVAVTTGFQNLRKWESVGATVKVTGEEVRMAGTPRLDVALQGMIPGVNITIPDGTVGANPKVRVRGTSTLMGNREPVWVVDGIIREDPFPFKDQNLDDILNSTDKNSMQAGLSIMSNGIAGLNPDDIDDITFLKDASASALYGVRAANGVIVITTKRGKAGRTIVNFRTDLSVTEKPSYNRTNVMNSSQRVALSKDIIASGVNYPAPVGSNTATGFDGPANVGYEGLYYQYINKMISQEEFNAGVTRLEMNNTDWFDVLFRNAINQNYSLNVSGGTDKATFYGSFGYNKTLNSAIGNDMDRLTGMLNADIKLNNKMKWHIGIDAASLKTNGFYNGVNPQQYALSTNREIKADEFYAVGDNTIGIDYGNGNQQYFTSHLKYNFLNELAHTGNRVDSKRFNFTTDLTTQITRSLNWKIMLAQNFDRSSTERWADEYSYTVAKIRGANFGELPRGSVFEQYSILARGGIIEQEQMNRDATYLRNMLNFNKNLGKGGRHNLNFMGGLELRSNSYKGTSTKNYGYYPDRGNVIDYDYSIVRANNPNDIFANKYYNRRTDNVANFLSYFASLTYSYAKKYTINLNGRNDASNRFGQYTNASFNPVWAIGARWDVLAEKWFDRRFTWINTLSLRSSFGFQGNIVETVGPNLIAQYVTPVYNPLTGEPYLAIKTMPYPDLRKEKTKTTNIGLDLSFLKNRIALTVDYYSKYSKDLISQRTVPIEYGTTQMIVNGSDMTNKGYDISLRVIPVQTKTVTWTLTINSSINTNKVVKPQYQPNLKTLTNGTALVNGYPVDGFWSFQFAGLNHDYGRPMFRYLDVDSNLALLKNGNPTQYLTYSGNALPRYSGGINTSIRYKNITLSANFNTALGYKVRLNPLLLAGPGGQYQAPAADKNVSQALANRWRKPGDELFTNIPGVFPRDDSPGLYIGDASLSTSTVGNSLYRYTMYNYSDLRVVDGSHLRCNIINLVYEFTPKQLQMIKGISRLNVACSVTNPFLVANSALNGQDPEITTTDANTVTPNMPRMRTVTLSVNLGL
ncbi:MAG: SusC/RagA family TonB-linked outer membrane protein [Filimonas sp.]|nr:SusC/RagA family TonB-linked outer membrane protein [Filimonas sp.]